MWKHIKFGVEQIEYSVEAYKKIRAESTKYRNRLKIWKQMGSVVVDRE
jgi:hypothetical protein